MSTLLKQVTQKFKPQGVTSLVLLAESHMSIHTWPEYGYAAVDAFTCGEGADPERACLFIAGKLRAGRHALRTIARGEEALQVPAPVLAAAGRFPARQPEQPFAG